MNHLRRFEGLINQDKAAAAEAERNLADLFGSAPPDRWVESNITRVIDASSSMDCYRDKAKAAFRKIQEEFPGVTWIDIAFADSISRLNSIQDYWTNGNTAMRDSLIAAIEVTEAETGHNNQVVILICDGEDRRAPSLGPRLVRCVRIGQRMPSACGLTGQ